MIDEYGAFGGIRIGGETAKHSEETHPSATLTTTNPQILT
jgi:hypothetical protein